MVTLRSVLETAIVPAFTIAAALIWKDVIVAAIQRVLPADGQLVSQAIAAIIATALVVIAIYVLLGTEEKAEKVVRQWRKGFDKKRR